ncbi:MAG: hypothetical protein KJ587_16055 [Alphaproteobacteria bacterium]|nr:hypothetical protein [Alphaproteobacteria bacterium]
MKVAEFRGILEDLQKIFSAGGAKGPAGDMAALADSVKGADAQDCEQFLQGLKETISADPGEKHLNALESAGLDDTKFEAAIRDLEKDRSLKSADLDKVGVNYTKSRRFAKLYKTRIAKLKQIRQAFKDKKDFASRGGVIDALSPWQ